MCITLPRKESEQAPRKHVYFGSNLLGFILESAFYPRKGNILTNLNIVYSSFSIQLRKKSSIYVCDSSQCEVMALQL